MKGQENMKRQQNVFENVYSEKIFEQDKLQSMQDMYCHSCQVYGAFIGEGSGKLTSFSGDKEEVKRLGDLLGMEYMYSLISELRCNSLEQQIIADTPYSNIKTAVISIQPNELCRLYGVFVGIMDDVEYSGEHAEEIAAFTYRTTTEKFELSLNFFRSVMEDLFTVKFKAYYANEESHKSKESERQMELELKRNEAMTEIVQMLEDDERFENILKKILKIAGEYLNISDSYIFQVQKKEGILKKTAGWRKEDLQGKVHDDSIPLEWIKDIEGRQIVASFGSPLRNSVKQFFAKYGLKAVICIPITVNDDVVMYAAFLEREQERIWDVSEIKFLNDVIKIIQSILIRRITKDSLASSYDSLTAILDNIGSGIYVVDKQSGEILFTNAILKTTFHNEIKEGTLNQLFEKAIPLNDEGCFFELFYEKKKHWYDLHYTDIVWVDGRKVRLCAIYDITDKKLYQKKIEMQANNDFLTGLYNRMRCETDLQKYIEKAKATGRQGALLYLGPMSRFSTN